MTPASDIAVHEIGAAKLTLRSDLVFTPSSSGGRKFFMVEDPLHGRFFRLGPTEYALVSMLDGRVSLDQALGRLSTAMPNHQLSQNDAVALCQWLLQMNLAQSSQSGRSQNVDKLVSAAEDTRRKKATARCNPLTFRLAISKSDRFYQQMHRWTGWLHRREVAVLGVVAAVIGAYLVVSQWGRFVQSSVGVFAPHNWIWLALCWLALKIVHETAHGVVCKRYGGDVKETGVMFVLLAPLAYVDVTSSWRFRSHWQRIHVALAGMYAELWIAAIAAIVWSVTTDGWVANLCYNLVVMAGVTTLLFNANPLMKFDGYYVLSDLLGMPNLYTNGQNFVRTWARRWLIGLTSRSPHATETEQWIIAIYGWLSFAWRWMITFGLIIAATTLLQGAGVALAALGVVLWIAGPAVQFARWLFGPNCPSRNRMRFGFVSAAAITGSLMFLTLTPWPGSRTAPAVVEFSPFTVVRATTDGFLRELYVHSGQLVREGDPLVRIENVELDREVTDLNVQIQQSLLRIRRHQQRAELAEMQVEQEQLESLRTQLMEKRAEQQQLVIRATTTGHVIARNLDSFQGAFVSKGDEILSLGDESKKELRFYIEQNDLAAFRRALSRRVQIDLPGVAIYAAKVSEIKPRAILAPPPALSATYGGPLAVRRVSRDEATDSELELLTPHFEGVISLTNRTDQASNAGDSCEALGNERASNAGDSCEARGGRDWLRAGLRGRVIYRPWDESLGEHLYHSVSRWIRDRAQTDS